MKYISKNLILLGLLVFPFASASGDELKLENLLAEELAGVPGTEIIVSRIYIPANTSLPKHWHPGEEFVYILQGSATLWQKDKDDIVAKEGEVLKIPLKQIHTAISGSEGVSALVFRVHEKGKPERVKVE